MRVGLQGLPPRFTCTDSTADVLWSYDYEKEGIVEVVESYIFHRIRSIHTYVGYS